jgi:hypothetical protein
MYKRIPYALDILRNGIVSVCLKRCSGIKNCHAVVILITVCNYLPIQINCYGLTSCPLEDVALQISIRLRAVVLITDAFLESSKPLVLLTPLFITIVAVVKKYRLIFPTNLQRYTIIVNPNHLHQPWLVEFRL